VTRNRARGENRRLKWEKVRPTAESRGLVDNRNNHSHHTDEGERGWRVLRGFGDLIHELFFPFERERGGSIWKNGRRRKRSKGQTRRRPDGKGSAAKWREMREMLKFLCAKG